MIRVASICKETTVDGPGIRSVLYVQGCLHWCEGCHNKHTWPLEGGVCLEIQEVAEKLTENPLIQGITISGGEPVKQAEEVTAVINAVKQLRPELDVMLYTGYDWEVLLSSSKPVKALLGVVDYVMDGRYFANRPTTKKFRGSDNQRFIDVKRSLALGRIVEVDE